jgi:hypothetical protein
MSNDVHALLLHKDPKVQVYSSVQSLLNINSMFYKLYIKCIINKNNLQIDDMIMIYGLLVYVFSINLLNY